MTEDKKTAVKVGRQPTFTEAIVISLIILAVLTYFNLILKAEIQISLFAACIVVGIYGVYLGYRFEQVEDMMVESLKIGMIAVLINILIGIIIAAWIVSGIVPYLIYIGLQIISPTWFLVTACLSCSLMSLVIGSSWTTAGTLGIALLGVGLSLGIPMPIIAGAIISGAFFGDKQSPLSETTVLAAAANGTTLANHVRSMLYTTFPALVISCIIYGIIGFSFVKGGHVVDETQVSLIIDTLKANFWFNPIVLLIPPAFLVWVVVKRASALVGLTISTVLACIIAMAFQGIGLYDLCHILLNGYNLETGVALVDSILHKGGMNSMWYTISVILLGLAFGGVLMGTKTLEAIVFRSKTFAHSVKKVVIASLIQPFILILVTCDGYIPIILDGSTYGTAYDNLELDRSVLSRCSEDTGTLGAPLVPWSTSSIFLASLLGMSPGLWMPYYFLGYITPMVSIFAALTGYGILYTNGRKGWGKKNRYIPGSGSEVA